MSLESAPVFILVHGTFASDAPWIQPDSKFSDQLRNDFGNGIEIIPFSWNGKNAHQERYDESQRLKEKLITVNKSYPDRRKIIIGHSHGGNLAIYALRDSGISSCFDLITLGTPFLNYRVRDFASSMSIHKLLLTFFVALFFTVTSTLLCVELIYRLLKFFELNETVINTVLFLSGVGILFEGGKFFVVRLYKRLDRFEKELPDFVKTTDRQYTSSYKKEYRILSIIHDIDEVKHLFASTYYLISNLFNVYDVSFRILLRLSKYAAIVLLLYIIPAGFIDGISEQDIQMSVLSQIVFTVCIAPIVAFLCLPYFTFYLAFFVLLLKSNPAIYGWENVKYMMFIHFTPDVQTDNAKDKRFESLPLEPARLLELRHSLYNDQRIFPIIKAWIQKEKTAE